MTQTNPRFARRSFLKGVGVGAGLLGGAVPPIALAQGAPPGAAPAIWSHEYWAKKGSVPLYLFRKRVRAPAAGEKTLPILSLVHGSSISARSSFDLTCPASAPIR